MKHNPTPHSPTSEGLLSLGHAVRLVAAMAVALAACGDSGGDGATSSGAGDTSVSDDGAGWAGDATAADGAGTDDTAVSPSPDAGDPSAQDTPGADDTAPADDGSPPSDVGTAPPPDTGGGPIVVDPPDVDCSAIPDGPFQLVKLSGPIASEDLAFDREGNVIGSNDTTIFKSKYNSTPVPFVPNLNFRAGLRYLPNGHLVVCNNNAGSLVRVDEEGVIHTLLTGLSYPNGITVDMEGWVYFTEHDKNLVKRVNPFTGEWTVLTDKISNPNGITFSVDYKTLYLGGFDGDPTVWSMSIAADGTPGKLIAFATGVGSGALDGMATDACGNVYIADYGATVIYRISPDGQDVKPVISGAGVSGAYLPNMQWGSGIGGWDPMKLYLPDGWNKGVFEVDIGVPGAPRPFP